MRQASVVTSTDVALLRALERDRSVVRASRRVGISRDRAVYRLGKLSRAFGGRVVRSARGGAAHGGTVLTALGDRIARGGFESVELLGAHPALPIPSPNLLHGTYRSAPHPELRVGRRLRLRVAFDADDGASVAAFLDPEAVVVARHRFPSSARNVLAGVVESLRRGDDGLELTLIARCAGVRLRASVTEEAVRQLRLRRGAGVWLYVKATALRRVDERARSSPGPPRS